MELPTAPAGSNTTGGMVPPLPAQFETMRSASIPHVRQLMFDLPKQRKIIGIILIQVAIFIVVITIGQQYRKRGAVVVYCETEDCVRHAVDLLTSVDNSVHPCRSFYGFVCGRWSRTHTRDDLLEEIHSRAVDIALSQLDRDALQSTKASAFFHSCMDSKLQRHENVRKLVALKRELGLVWPEERYGNDHPLSVMLKMAIKWNLNFLFQVRVVSGRESYRTLFITRGFLGITWEESQEKSLSSYRKHVEEHFKVLSVTPSNVNYTELWQLEDAIIQAKLDVIHKSPAQDWFPIGKIGHRTPSIPVELWIRLLNKYFQGQYTWTLDSFIAVEHYKILENIEKLFQSYGEDKLAIGLAWVFIQTHLWVLYDKPELQFKHCHEMIQKYACLEYVNLYFGLQSIVDHVVHRYASKEMRKKVESLPGQIKRAATTKIREAMWIPNDMKENYARKVSNIEMSLLPPSDFFTVKGREDIYGIFPAINGSSFMADLLTVANFYASLVSHERYGDIYSRTTSATYGPARYIDPVNSVLVPMNALEPPLYYTQAVASIEYGGLGSYLAREVSRCFGPHGLNGDEEYGNDTLWWGTTDRASEHKRNSDCVWNGTARTNSRNGKAIDLFPSLPALEIAFAAYKEAVSETDTGAADVKLRTLDKYTGDMLFFMTYCHGMCSAKSHENAEICDTSLMNFRPFAETYKCPAGSPMNPALKCSFFNGN
ncbi:neprilysin-1 [Rhipicephalus microplus]|uniref:neprilysin-1 n=1 Tax=Rhipicephalus microplus TaxID=6941 RepID=UPI003F6D51EE